MPCLPGPTTMRAVRFLFSPGGRLKPQPFVYGAIAVYAVGLASHWLTAPDVIARGGLWPFVAAQVVLIWIWFMLHARRMHDAGRGSGLAVGVALLYTLSIALLLIIADGFSCREQIAQGTDRHALHLAEVLQMALHAPPPPCHSDRSRSATDGVVEEPAVGPYPESAEVRQREAEISSSMKRAGLGLGALAAGGFLLWQFTRTR